MKIEAIVNFEEAKMTGVRSVKSGFVFDRREPVVFGVGPQTDMCALAANTAAATDDGQIVVWKVNGEPVAEFPAPGQVRWMK